MDGEMRGGKLADSEVWMGMGGIYGLVVMLVYTVNTYISARNTQTT